MLKQRVLTAIVLIALLSCILYTANVWLLSLTAAVILFAAAWEWSNLIPVKPLLLRLAYALIVMLACWVCFFLYEPWFILTACCWLLILAAMLSYPQTQKTWGKPWIVAFVGCLILPLFMTGLVKLYTLPAGLYLLLNLLFLIWAADTGAYFSGRRFGRHKLMPKVSPGKSWEGVYGGMLAASLIAVATYFWVQPGNILSWWLVSMAIVIISIMGDLFISLLKRRLGLKDSGTLLPGHGGVLDRLDSLIAALPFYYGLMTYLLSRT